MSAASRQWDAQGLFLVLNAAEGDLQIAVGDREGKLLFGSVISAQSRGAEVLAPALESGFSLLGRRMADVARVAAVRGPGSFTGVRLTAATAAALSRAVSASQAGLDYMRCIARECLPFCKSMPAEALLWILVRARRDLVYAQPFLHDRGDSLSFRALADLAVLPVSGGEAAAHILETVSLHGASRVLLAGSGARENRDHFVVAFGAKDMRATFLDVVAPWPKTLLAEARAAEYGEADIEPLYVRVSDAEADLPRIAVRLGLDPDDAAETLRRLTHALPEEDSEN